jgi:hypothetical protein
MPWQDWFEVKTLHALSKHTTSIVAAGLSFWVTGRALRWALGPGSLNVLLEYSGQAILLILFLWFTYQMLLLLWKARVKIPNGLDLLSLVA